MEHQEWSDDVAPGQVTPAAYPSAGKRRAAPVEEDEAAVVVSAPGKRVARPVAVGVYDQEEVPVDDPVDDRADDYVHEDAGEYAEQEPADDEDPREYDDPPRDGGRRRGCCLGMAIGLVLLLVAGWFAGSWAVGEIKSRFGDAPDYAGPGSGKVLFQVKKGDTPVVMGRSLKSAGVVKSVQAFTDAAKNNDRVTGIQVGYYAMKKQMRATDAIDVLVNPKNLIRSVVTVPEGARVRDMAKLISAKTDIRAGDVTAALSKPGSLGLPPEARGNPEGYLFPATYQVVPGETATTLLRQMVAKTRSVEQDLGIDARAGKVGLTREQVLTMASLLEYEGQRSADLPKIARVFYNRIGKGIALQSDATVAYANHLQGTVWTTRAQRDNPSPYNTYVHTGLPPGPIGSPGSKTIEAALQPANGPWLFFVPINLRTGETAFATTLAEHNRNVAKLRAWCAKTHSENCR